MTGKFARFQDQVIIDNDIWLSELDGKKEVSVEIFNDFNKNMNTILNLIDIVLIHPSLKAKCKCLTGFKPQRTLQLRLVASINHNELFAKNAYILREAVIRQLLKVFNSYS